MIRPVTDADLDDVRAFLEARAETALFLLSSLEEHGPALGPAMNSGNFKCVERDGRLRAVLCLTRRGNLLAQTDGEDGAVHEEILEACAAEPIELRGVVAEWSIAGALWPAILARDASFRETYASCEVLYRLPLGAAAADGAPADARVRALTPADFETCEPLIEAYLTEEGLSLQGTGEQRRADFTFRAERGRWWGLFEDGRLVSIAALNARYGRIGQIGGVFTVPACRRRGLSRAVMTHLIADGAGRHGLDRLVLFTGERNAAARALYESLGFEAFGRFGLLFGERDAATVPAASAIALPNTPRNAPTRAPSATRSAVEAARAHRAAHGVEIIEELAEFLAIPNVATDRVNIRRNAEAIQAAFARRGAVMELIEQPGAPPLVRGEIRTPGAARTLGMYAHYDGQPVDEEVWTDPPWTPTLRTAALEAGGRRRRWPRRHEPIDPEWRIFARSAADDKAPFIALLAALDALRAASIPLTSNVIFMFDGEEETGSDHLGTALDAHLPRFRADVWLVCDGPVHQSGRPQIVFGARGIAGLDVTVYGAARYLHSGHYGNWAPNPSHDLARLLASMTDGDGRVLVEGFYDGIAPLSERERRAIAALPNADDALRDELALVATEGGGAPLVERVLLPSLNVRGLQGGTVGKTARNVIPSSATASIGLRLVKGNDPERMLDLVEAHVRRQGYHVVADEPDRATRLAHRRIARITREGGYPASRTSMDLPVVAPLVDAVRRASHDGDVLLVPTLGGSLPLWVFEEKLGAPSIIVPMANHDNNQHGPDENLRVANLWYGVDLMAAILTMGEQATKRRSDEATKGGNETSEVTRE